MAPKDTSPPLRPAAPKQQPPASFMGMARMALFRRPLGFPADAYLDHDQLLFGGSAFEMFLPTREATVRQITARETGSLIKSNSYRRQIGPLAGDSLLFAEGEDWKRLRRVAASRFLPAQMMPVADATLAKTLADLADGAWPEDQDIDLRQNLRGLSISVAASVLFSVDVAPWTDRFWVAVDGIARTLGHLAVADFLMPLSVPTPDDLRRRPHERALRRIAAEIVDARLKDGPGDDAFEDHYQAELEATGDPEAARDRIAHHVRTWLAAGAVTTADALGWCLYLLARDADAQTQAAEEALSVDEADGAAHTPAGLPVLNAIWNETLRLYPPIISIGRRATCPAELNETPIRTGCSVVLSPLLIGRHRDHWDDADAFCPARFLDGETAARKYTHIPFSIGSRVCPGKLFATVEALTFLAALLRRFEIRVSVDDPTPPRLNIGVVMSDRIRVRLRAR